MNATVHAFKQYDVHLLQQFGNSFHDLDPHAPELSREHLHPILACGNARATGITRHNFETGELARRFWVVEDFGEGGNVRSIKAYHPYANRGAGILRRCSLGEE